MAQTQNEPKIFIIQQILERINMEDCYDENFETFFERRGEQRKIKTL